jgi:hypothetical protein
LEADRAQRGGIPRTDPDTARKAAMESQRLEGVDARSCLTSR